MSEIRYVPLPDATPEKEIDALAVIYRFILDSHAKERDAEIGDGEGDVERPKNGG